MTRALTLTLTLALTLAASLAAPLAAQSAAPVTFKDDVRQYLMRGEDTDRRDVSLIFDAAHLVVQPRKGDPTIILYANITTITYDRRAKVRKMNPRMGAALDHFLTVQFKDASGRGDFVEVEMEKGVAPRIVAIIEARSGKPVARAVGG